MRSFHEQVSVETPFHNRNRASKPPEQVCFCDFLGLFYPFNILFLVLPKRKKIAKPLSPVRIEHQTSQLNWVIPLRHFSLYDRGGSFAFLLVHTRKCSKYEEPSIDPRRKIKHQCTIYIHDAWAPHVILTWLNCLNTKKSRTWTQGFLFLIGSQNL